ncbi:hypothetical protein JL722_2710 [Aureococcus anophagefferens]|nr:hypothetical protein JL722_2710 [Aureococcus anophagefferens]
MANLFRIVLSMAKRHDALQTYESSVDLADLNGVEVGQRKHSRFTARSMARVAAAKGRSQVKVFLERRLDLRSAPPGFARFVRSGLKRVFR